MTPEAFAKQVWGARPAVVSSMFDRPPIEREGLFAGLQTATRCSASGQPVDLRLFVNQALRIVDRRPLLPAEDDLCLRDYIKRTRAQLDLATSFCLIVRHFQLFDPQLWRWLRSAFAPLYAHIGIPEDTVNSLFVGDYTVTPFGVHTDADHTFYFPLLGRRTLLLWEPEFPHRHSGTCTWHLEGNGGSMDYLAHRDAAVRLSVGPGEVLYWPPGWWHVAEGPAGDALAMSVGIPAPGASLACDLVAERIRAHADAALRMHAATDDGALPSALARQADLLRELGSTAETELAAAWLRRRSSLGFKLIPEPRPRPVLADDDVVSAQGGELLWQPTEQAILCASHGYSLRLPQHDVVVALLELVAGGGSWTVAELCDRSCNEPGDHEFVHEVLHRLYTMRALDTELTRA